MDTSRVMPHGRDETPLNSLRRLSAVLEPMAMLSRPFRVDRATLVVLMGSIFDKTAPRRIGRRKIWNTFTKITTGES